MSKISNLRPIPRVDYLFDIGHGYFKISENDLKRLGGNEEMFTPYSFKNDNYFFLENKTDGRTLFDLFKKVFNNDTKFIHGKREIPHRQFDIGVARGIYQRINEEKYAEDHPELFEWE